MNFPELLSEVDRLKCAEKRAKTDCYLEAVVTQTECQPLAAILGVYFGTPLKPAGAMPSGDAGRYSKPYGGVRRDQTMYYRKSEGFTDVALLWPWGDGNSVTVKIIRE
jgi:hypothetical protein